LGIVARSFINGHAWHSKAQSLDALYQQIGSIHGLQRTGEPMHFAINAGGED
jgi:hypothetical protein